MAPSTFLMCVGYSLAGLACTESVKSCQKALACSDGARLDALGVLEASQSRLGKQQPACGQNKFLQLSFFSPGLEEGAPCQVQGFSLGLLLSDEETDPGLLPLSHMQ